MTSQLRPEKDLYNSNCGPGGVEWTGHVSSKGPEGGEGLAFSENSCKVNKAGAESRKWGGGARGEAGEESRRQIPRSWVFTLGGRGVPEWL